MITITTRPTTIKRPTREDIDTIILCPVCGENEISVRHNESVLCVCGHWTYSLGAILATSAENDQDAFLGKIREYADKMSKMASAIYQRNNSQADSSMTQKEAKNLRNGLYLLNWTNHKGSSLAAVGRNEAGEVWFAPTNWVVVPWYDWSKVASAYLLYREGDIQVERDVINE